MGKKMLQLKSCDKFHIDEFKKAFSRGFNVIKRYHDQKSFDVVEINDLDIGVFWFKTDTWDYILENIDLIKSKSFWSMFVYQLNPSKEDIERCLTGAKELEKSFGELKEGTITLKFNIKQQEDFLKLINLMPEITKIPSVQRVILYLGEREFSDVILLQQMARLVFYTNKYNFKLSTCHAGEVKGLERYSTMSACIDNHISNELLNATNAVCKVNYENESPLCMCHKALSLTGVNAEFIPGESSIRKSHIERYKDIFDLSWYTQKENRQNQPKEIKQSKEPKQDKSKKQKSTNSNKEKITKTKNKNLKHTAFLEDKIDL